ncbi:hypothetical protein J437_LFUL000756 [Ladona fulva]|uniref:Uncharacterized protein n=1 Tax=Ladona fulva TaxID=123851 RepID=A0A8K0KR39_LADFU|nr:hypothetical protein J437_LFUL000756 [Ladona fulva]
MENNLYHTARLTTELARRTADQSYIDSACDDNIIDLKPVLIFNGRGIILICWLYTFSCDRISA